MKISKETAKVVLYNILILYFSVRAFSFAKNIVEKSKIEQRKKGKEKTLRTSLNKIEKQLEK